MKQHRRRRSKEQWRRRSIQAKCYYPFIIIWEEDMHWPACYWPCLPLLILGVACLNGSLVDWARKWLVLQMLENMKTKSIIPECYNYKQNTTWMLKWQHKLPLTYISLLASQCMWMKAIDNKTIPQSLLNSHYPKLQTKQNHKKPN